MGDEGAAHRYISFHERLKNITIDLSRESSTSWGSSRLHVAGLDAPASAFADATGSASSASEASELASTAFGTALRQWSELNLSLQFQNFYSQVMPKSQSLVLLLHCRDEVAKELDTFLTLRDIRNWHAWDALLDLVPRMAFDLGPEFLPVYPMLLTALLRASSLMNKNLTHGDEALAARLAERAFHSAAWLFRAISTLMVREEKASLLLTSWDIVRDVLAQDRHKHSEDNEPNDSEDLAPDSDDTVTLAPKAHTCRFATEALAHLMRKAPAAQLRELVPRMLADANRLGKAMENAVAATWASCTKTAAHALHSRTAEILTLLLHTKTEFTELRKRIGERVLTSMVHHAHAADLNPVLSLLLSWARKVPMDDELASILTWLTAVAGTRKGTRLSDASKDELWSWLATIDQQLPWTAPHRSLLESYVILICVAFPSARVQDMTGHGKKILQGLASRPQKGDFDVTWAALDGVFRALGDPEWGWSSFSSLALPFALEATSLVFHDSAPKAQENSALALLASLAMQGHLSKLNDAPPTTVVLRWSKRTKKVVQSRFESLAGSFKKGHFQEEDLESLLAAPLVNCFPASGLPLARVLTDCISELAGMDTNTFREQKLSALGLLISSLVSVIHVSNKAVSEIKPLFSGSPSLFSKLLSENVLSHSVLPALAELAKVAHVNGFKLVDASYSWDILSDAVMLPDRDIVLAALQILALTHSGAEFNVFDRLTDVESNPLDVAHITSRNVLLRQAQRDIGKHLKNSDYQYQALIRYAIGALKLNFKPVWSATRETLSALSSSHLESVWKVSFSEIRTHDPLVRSGDMAVDTVFSDEEWLPEDDTVDEMEDVDHDEVYHLYDAVLVRRLRILKPICRVTLAVPSRRCNTILHQRATAHFRFDDKHFVNELLMLYEQCAVLAERHSDAFVPYVEAQWSSLLENDGDASLSGAERTERLSLILRIFREFRHPAKMHDAALMKGWFLELCAQPELSIQRLALKCLLTWREPWLAYHEGRMNDLLNPVKFRDTLSHTDLSASSEQLTPEYRSQTMGVMVRLLYGLMLSKRGSHTSGAGQKARRAAILSALYESTQQDLSLLVDLMLGSLNLPSECLVNGVFTLPTDYLSVHPRKQSGLLMFLGDVLKHLGRPLAFCTTRLVEAVILITAQASSGTDESSKNLRRMGLARLTDFVSFASVPSWAPYRNVILEKLVKPRLVTFADDSVQSTSALLELCRAWSFHSDTLLCFLSDPVVLNAIYAGLSRVYIKPAVAQSILDMAERILNAGDSTKDDSETAMEIQQSIVIPTSPALLAHLVPLVQHTIRTNFSHALSQQVRDELLRKELGVLSLLAPHMTQEDDAASLLSLLVPLIRHSGRAVSERTKTELLHTLAVLLPRAQSSPASLEDLYGLLSRLGSELRSRLARAEYARAFAQLGKVDSSLARLASWVESLNSYSKKTMDEPDWEERLKACDDILASKTKITAKEWHALLYHAFYFLMEDDLVLRTNASAMFQRFVREAKTDEHINLVNRVLMPGLRRRLHSRHEAVRKELLVVLDLAVVELSEQVPSLSELQALRTGGEEASVLLNFYHIQSHRRVRALHRLGDAAEAGELRSRTLSDIFVPLTWLYLLPGQSGGIDMNLANEALSCIRRMAKQLRWSHYYHWLSRFMRELKTHMAKDETSSTERLHVRGVVGILEAFHFDCHEEVTEEETQDAVMSGDENEAPSAPERLAEDLSAREPEAMSAERRSALATTITTRVLPPLHEAMQVKDEDRLPARLPLIIGAARLAQHLPEDRRMVELFKVFASLAGALRSKLQSTRDACRETALNLVKAVGVSFLPDVVRELRRGLTRGPQRAVCAYTVHNLVVALGTPASSGATPLLTELDDGVKDIVAASMEDVFGLTSEDRAAVEYKTKVRELRQSKSIDTFEHVARLSKPERLQELLIPLRGVIATTLEPKTLRVVSECLQRIASGMSANEHVDAASFLVLCYTLIAKGPKALHGREAEAPHLAQNAHMFVELGLSLLTTALRRSRFDIQDPDTVAKLIPLVKAVGETLYAPDAPVVERGLRAAAALACCPLPTLEDALPVMQKQMVALLRHAGSLHSAMAQTALRSLAVVIREGRSAPPPARQLTELLNLVSMDLETPAVQASVFALLRAIVSRAYVVPEVYDVMDRVAELLVVSHDEQVREVNRALYLQFLLDYPQGQGRLQSQLQFLAKHLAYENEGGRKSVLQLVDAILSKFSQDVVSKYAELFFVALVMQLANEESTSCRKLAAKVLGTLFSHINERERDSLLKMTKGWAMAEGSAQAQQLAAVALRVYEIASQQNGPLRLILQDSTPAIVRALEHAAEEMDADTWRLPYQAMQTMQSLATLDTSAWQLWVDSLPNVVALLTFPHAWCRVAASRVLGAYFAAAEIPEPALLLQATRQLVSQLYSPFLDDALTLQAVRNLVFIGKLFAGGHGEDDDAEASDSDESETDDEMLESEEGQASKPPSRLAWLFSKLSHAGRLVTRGGRTETAPQRVGTVLKWMAAMATQLDVDVVSHFLIHILSPILRVMDDDQAPEDLKLLASEVQDLVQEKVGPSQFTRTYAHVKQSVLDKRRERKNARLLEAVANPEKAAQRRMSRNTARHESRKRKNAQHRYVRLTDPSDKRQMNKRSKSSTM